MNYAVISDVHANIEALRAVLTEIRNKKITDILFLGDAVGYGPDPDECVEVLKSECKVLLAGNHDKAAIGLTDIEFFTPYARAAIEWTKETITEKTISILKDLPVSKEIEDSKILLVHSTPKQPEEWHYLLSLWDAEINFHYFENKICLLGHSHRPSIIERLPSGEMIAYRDEAMIGDAERYMINAGSVGRPRDGDPMACYVVIDDESVKLHRVEYDIKKTQDKMRRAGLPIQLIERLARGV
ncbi:MAG: metallophosphatase family protein [Nitrospirae bacterium]|nr:metallophosphatase family protein [Nitrospirota bacterium]MCL5978331.1 metallophosphatase family protein [Nitrospirota bacterium]